MSKACRLRLDSIKTLGDLDETKPTNLAEGFTPEKDETAADLDDGHAISATRSQLHYDMVSCDTQDYFFTFQIPQLAKAASSQEATRKIRPRPQRNPRPRRRRRRHLLHG